MVLVVDQDFVHQVGVNMKKILSRTLALAGVSLLAATMYVSPANASPAPPEPTSVAASPSSSLPQSPLDVPDLVDVSGNLSLADQEKVASGDPLTVVIDVKTGMIEEIKEPALTGVQPFALVVKSNCSNVQGCYYSGGVPYADFGFSGLIFAGGTQMGNWAHRSGYGSQTRTVSACSIYGCYAKAGPGHLVAFASTVTGTSFTIY